MKRKTIKKCHLANFVNYLYSEEMSKATVEKYLRDVKGLFEFCGDEVDITKETVIAYKNMLLKKNYAVSSVNSMLASLNSFFDYLGRQDCRVKMIKYQKELYISEDRELTRSEYLRLVETAKRIGKDRINVILQTVAGTGIRISELKYITVESAIKGYTEVSCKGKKRKVFIVKKIQKVLIRYAKMQKITSGMIFITRSGKPLDRSNIWRDMKALCEMAGVSGSKVFPHNFRHLFAKLFYGIEKDIAKLADILGHSSINTTRIYIKTSGIEHRQLLNSISRLL